jgi:Fe-S-cluster containining protein
MADDDRYLTRRDFERALRHLNIADLDVRDLVLKLAAEVVALTTELKRRLPLAEDEAPIDTAVDQSMPEVLHKVLSGDDGCSRVALEPSVDKYEVEPVSIPCDELIPLCEGRCCSYTFSLSTQDLDEGVIRFDYGQPYMIRQRSSDGYCVHNDPTTHACDSHAHRPKICRTYDCRNDKRVWIDYEKRIPAPRDRPYLGTDPGKLDRYERVRLRGLAIYREQMAIDGAYADGVPRDKTRQGP